MYKKSYAFICIAISLLLISGIFSGCGKKSETSQDNTTPETQTVEESSNSSTTQASNETTKSEPVFTLPLTETKQVLKVATFDISIPDKSLKDNLPVYQELEKRTNVSIDWEVTKADYGAVMNTRLAAAADLPDIVGIPGGYTGAPEYGVNGLLIDLLPLINQYAPNIKKFLYSDRPDVRKMLTSSDGKIYALPGNTFGLEEGKNSNDDVNSVTMLYRKDWLTKLTLKTPETIDELYEALKAIKNNDPNGNKKNDEIPAGFYVTSQAPYSWYFWSGMFGLHLAGGDYYYDSNNKVINEWMLPQAKEFITVMNKWWTEGLIDRGMPTMTVDKWIAQVQDGLTGFTTANLGHVPSWDPAVKKKDPNGELAAMLLPIGKNGERVELGSSPIYGGFSITRDCKNPELAVKWLDYAYFSEDGIRFMEFGIQDTSYEMKDGKPVFIEQFIQDAVAKDGLTNAMTRLGSLPNGVMPQIYTSYGRNQSFNQIYINAYKYLFDIGLEVKKYTVPPFPGIIPTNEESDSLKALQTDYETYKNEMVIKFITGTEPMSNWETFIDKLKSLQVDKIIQIKQAQFDRYINN